VQFSGRPSAPDPEALLVMGRRNRHGSFDIDERVVLPAEQAVAKRP
jgi:hypothetical protein